MRFVMAGEAAVSDDGVAGEVWVKVASEALTADSALDEWIRRRVSLTEGLPAK